MRSIRANRGTPATDDHRWRLGPAMIAAAALLVVAATAAVAVGCGSSSGVGGGSASAASLAGTSWKLTGWSANSLDPNDFTITAEFADGRIGGKSAVNQYGGPYTAADDGSFSTGELVSTMMAGPEPEMRAEQIYLKLLAEVRKYQLGGKTLTLSDANGNQSLIYAAASPAAPGE